MPEMYNLSGELEDLTVVNTKTGEPVELEPWRLYFLALVVGSRNIDLFMTNCIAGVIMSRVRDQDDKTLTEVTRHSTGLYLQLHGMIHAVIKNMLRGKSSKAESVQFKGFKR